MPRQLPWKRSPETQTKSFADDHQQLPALPPPSSSSRRRAEEARPAASTTWNSSDQLRSPSTSPPPQPPQQRPMLPADDKYRMVEDELLQTAQRFTAHLHRAEYSRLKLAAAAAKTTAATATMRRPVVGPLTSQARRRRDRAEMHARQRAVLAAGEDGLLRRRDDDGRGCGGGGGGLRSALAGADRGELLGVLRCSGTTPVAGGERETASRAATASPTASMASSTALSPRPRAGPSASDGPQTPTPLLVVRDDNDDEDDGDDPFGIDKRRLERQRLKLRLQRNGRHQTPTKNTTSPSDTMPLFV